MRVPHQPRNPESIAELSKMSLIKVVTIVAVFSVSRAAEKVVISVLTGLDVSHELKQLVGSIRAA